MAIFFFLLIGVRSIAYRATSNFPISGISTQISACINLFISDMKTREERSRLYFDENNPMNQPLTSNLMDLWQDTDSEMIDRQFESSRPGISKTQQQLFLMEEDNALHAKIRSQEVDNIVKSIADLNHLFKDLSHMIVHQVGTDLIAKKKLIVNIILKGGFSKW